MGFFPKLRGKPGERNTIFTNPNINKPYGLDFDGDTLNLHTPVSKQAVQNVIQKMLPSRNLLSPKNMKAHYLPQAEFLQGLYLGTRSRPDQKPVRFRSAAEMLKALRRGEITYDTPVEIMD